MGFSFELLYVTARSSESSKMRVRFATLLICFVFSATATPALNRQKRFWWLWGDDAEADAVEETEYAAADVVGTAVDVVGDAAETALDVAGDVVEGAADIVGGAVDVVGDVAGGVLDVAGDILGGAADIVGAAVDVVGDVAGGVVDVAGDILGGAVDFTGDVAGGVLDVAGDVVGGAADIVGGAVDFTGDVLGVAVDLTGDVVGGALDLTGDVIEGVADVAGDVVGGVGDFFGGLWCGIFGCGDSDDGSIDPHATVAASGFGYSSAGVVIDGAFEAGLSAGGVGQVVANLSPVLGADIDIAGHINFKKIIKTAHRLKYRGLSNTAPLDYSMDKFRTRRFSVAAATVGSIGHNEFRLNFKDMPFLATGKFDMTVGAIGLDLGGRM